MKSIGIKYGANPKLFKWNEIIKSIYHNLGNRAGNKVVHFAVDMTSAMEYVGNRQPDYKNGLIVDSSLETDVSNNYPEEDIEYLENLVFFRGFCFESGDVQIISDWVYEIFFESPSYIWVDGKMTGGLCFPQEPASEDEYPALKENLSDFVCLRE